MKRASWLVPALALVAACGVRGREEAGPPPPSLAAHEIQLFALTQRIRDLVDDSLEGRIPGTPGGARTTDMIAADFKAHGLKPGGDDGGYLQRVTDSASSANVIGLVPGQLPVDSGYVLITAHWDNVRPQDGKPLPGTVDNAGGVAILLEMAAAFMRLSAPPRHSVLFLAATGGETGGSGVAWYAAHPTVPLSLITGAIELDGFDQWGLTRDIAVAPGSDSVLVALLGERLALVQRVTSVAGPMVQWCAPTSPLASHNVPLLRPAAGSQYFGREASFGADRLREYVSRDRHRATDTIRPDWDISGAVADAQAIFLTAVAMAERLSPRSR